jgi:hypothetical protein
MPDIEIQNKTFFSVTVDVRNLIFGHIVGSVFGPVRFLLPVCRLSWFLYTLNIHVYAHFSQQLLMVEIWYLVTSFIYVPHIVGSVFGSIRFLLPVCRLLIFIHIEHTFCICPFLVTFFSATIDGRNLIFGHKLYLGTPYRGKRFLTRQIPTSCLPKSGGIISEH